MMNPQFFEFLGRYFLAMSRGQQQIEDLLRLFHQGEGTSLPLPFAWSESLLQFQESFRATFRMLGWVPEEEYRVLEEELKQMRQKILSQEKTIAHLRLAIDAGMTGSTPALGALGELARKQGEAFQELMKSFFPPET